ncbi:4413f791-9eda-472e-9854-851783dd53b9-CDS [Sclerotinia trifoliorum]|uniref:4413f791-9eda-472e-9854-851783dd53b9-CDS n=1 Tax=Sclerotinia trifoliorum TaxID=28548 RepID=A0A8H2VV08_9HELO|nr:4413f791-9eda-472e-9854-851783dd53b9-CDS [Sclerotinia trifoliorum]
MVAPINPPTSQPNNPSPKPPPAPVLAPTTNTPSKPMGRKSSSIFFHQPMTNSNSNWSPNNSNLQSDRSLFVSVEGTMFLDIRGPPPTTSNKRRKNLHTPILEDVPAFFLPGPANRSLVDALSAIDVKTNCKDTHYSVGSMEALDLAGDKDAETFKVVGSRKRVLGSMEMQGRGIGECNSVVVGAPDAVPIKCMEDLRLDDKRVDGDGDVDMHSRHAESPRLGKGKRRFSAGV